MKTLALLLSAAALVGCDFDDDDDDFEPPIFPPDDDDDDGIPPPPPATLQWTADITGLPPYGSIVGESLVQQRLDEQAFTASISIRNDAAGAVRPWHVHFGSCNSGGGIVGNPAAYTLLTTDADGAASTTVRIETPLIEGDAYHVNVHLAPNQLEIITACGDLVRTP